MASPQTKDRDILPTNVKPLHYDITLNLDVNVLPYSGEVRIELDVLDPTDSITLNSVDLDIENASIEDASGKQIEQGLRVSHNKDKQTATINLGTRLASGSKAALTLLFRGTLKDSILGLFQGHWKDEHGNTKHQISSQFEAVHARNALPCFDEPGLKATFTVTIVAEQGLTCLSNMPVVRKEDTSEGKTAVTFDKTPLMSTYLLAFAVGELNMIETSTFRLPVRLYASPNNDIESGRWALELAAKALVFFEERLGVPFPLPKTDLITIPDFYGAMEHWGLVTFREDMLLFDSKTGTIDQKRLIGDVVLHELAHQWFGNLVTMDWWDGIWLNEGFATWASMYGMDHFFPEWKVRQHYLVDVVESAFDLDSLRSSHAIEAHVRTAEEVNQLFDAVSYEKGCSVIRMLAAYMGEEVFMTGIQKYLNQHRYGSTSTNDLWVALSESSGMDVAAIMAAWTLRVGHPLVRVTESGDSLHLEQNRFLRTGDVKPEEDRTLYPITLNVQTKDGQQQQMIFDSREVDIALKADLVKLNSNHIGFYRTAYSPERLATLGKQLHTFSVEDRFGVISDALALTPAGYQNTSDVLSLLHAYRNEDDVIVWKQVIAAIESIRIAWMFEHDTTQDALREVQRHLVAEKAHKLGWDLSQSIDDEERSLKALLFRAAAMSGDKKVKGAAFDMFRRFKNGDRDAIHPDIKVAVFHAVVYHGNGTDEFDTVLREFKASKTNHERSIPLNALGNTRQPELIRQTLALLLTDEVKMQEVNAALLSLVRHRDGVTLAWEWLKQHYEEVRQKVDTGMPIFGNVVSACTANLSSEEAAEEVERFFETKDTKSFNSSVAQSVDSIRVKAKWLSHGREDVRRWLAKSRD